MTKDEWDKASIGGRRWAYYGGAGGASHDSPVVRVIRWYRSGVLVRFTDGRQVTVHPHDLQLAVTR